MQDRRCAGLLCAWTPSCDNARTEPSDMNSTWPQHIGIVRRGTGLFILQWPGWGGGVSKSVSDPGKASGGGGSDLRY